MFHTMVEGGALCDSGGVGLDLSHHCWRAQWARPHTLLHHMHTHAH